jgi:hypothetical protein
MRKEVEKKKKALVLSYRETIDLSHTKSIWFSQSKI